jgi:hypothetical protein
VPRQAGATEITKRRREDVSHWRNPDGTRTAEFRANQHYPDGTGAYQTIDLNFRQVSATEWVAERSRHRVRAYRESGVNWLEITHRASGKGIRYQVPLSATVQDDHVQFTGFGLTWRYYLTKTGVKLESSQVASSLGPKSYDFTVQLVGGATLAETANAAGGLDGDSFLIPRAKAHCADGATRDLSAWSRVGSTATFSMDDTEFPPEAYPYTVDPPTTFNITASGNDGMVYKTGAGYPPPGSVLRLFTNNVETPEKSDLGAGNYQIVNGVYKWDTSSLSDAATVTGATFRVQTTTTGLANSRSFRGEWYVFDGTDADYVEDAGTDAIADTLISTIGTNQQVDFTLSNAATGVAKNSNTGLRVGISGTTTPTGQNYVTIAGFDHATLTEPQLLVDYTEPPTEALRPTAVSGLTNLSGSHTDIDEDPDGTITDAGLVGSDPSGGQTTHQEESTTKEDYHETKKPLGSGCSTTRRRTRGGPGYGDRICRGRERLRGKVLRGHAARHISVRR